jgi:hypothetical protein
LLQVSDAPGMATRFILQRKGQKLAHHVDLGIEWQGRYRRVTGPLCESAETAADEAKCEIAGCRTFVDWRAWRAVAS